MTARTGAGRGGGAARADAGLYTAAMDRVTSKKRASPQGQGKRAKPRTRQDKKGHVVYVAPEVTKALKRLALDHDTTVNELGRIALSLLFTHYGLERPFDLPAVDRPATHPVAAAVAGVADGPGRSRRAAA